MRRLVLALCALCAPALAAAPAQAASPLFVDTWDYTMQSTKTRGPNGHFEGSWNFERPNIIRLAVPGYGLSKRVPLKPRRGWLVGTFKEARKCLRIGNGKQNVYRYRRSVYLRATKVHDMDGELVASAARFRSFSATKPCIGRTIAGWFKGRTKRQVGPESRGAEISYESPDGCNPGLVRHSADEDSSFLDWDLPEISHTWTFSGGGTSSQREPRYSYPGPGVYSASVLIRSINGSIAKGTQAIEVSQPDPDC
jgi:hypothetical protein